MVQMRRGYQVRVAVRARSLVEAGNRFGELSEGRRDAIATLAPSAAAPGRHGRDWVLSCPALIVPCTAQLAQRASAPQVGRDTWSCWAGRVCTDYRRGG